MVGYAEGKSALYDPSGVQAAMRSNIVGQLRSLSFAQLAERLTEPVDVVSADKHRPSQGVPEDAHAPRLCRKAHGGW